VNSFRTFQEDDENDTNLFSKAEEFVLKNCPNPNRIGCPGPATLRAFVESPRDVSVAELHDVHIMQCAECTRDLMELRRQRTERLAKTNTASPAASGWNWRHSAIAASICLIAFAIFALHFERSRDEMVRVANDNSPITFTLDLHADGSSRGPEEPSAASSRSVPGKLLDLHIMLPYYSSPGRYKIFVSKQRNLSTVVVSGEADASSDGPNTTLILRMDLRKVLRGGYFLGTEQVGEDSPYYYPISID